MPRLPRVSAAQARRAIMRDGWRLARTRGSHEQYEHPTKPGLVTIPGHAGTIKTGTIKSIIVQRGLTIEQFVDLL